MTTLAFLDTETTSLRHDRRAWEIGLIVRNPEREQREYHAFIATQDLNLGNADLGSLKIGRFYERHPEYSGRIVAELQREANALREVERLTRGAHIIGAVPNFDTEVLGNRMREHGICPSWHYHVICVEALTVGYLSGVAAEHYDFIGEKDRAAQLRALTAPPWNSDDLSAALGVKVSEEDRHTALGDAKWAMRVYDAVMGGAAS